MKKNILTILFLVTLVNGLFSRCSIENPINKQLIDTTKANTSTENTSTIGTTYYVSSAKEINELSELMPGDTIIMTNGQWLDQKIIFKANGSEQYPIILKAQTEGEVILTGLSTLSIGGDYLHVEGLTFKNGTVSGNVIEFRVGSLSSNHCRLTKTKIENYSPADKTINSKWISLYGTYNRVDHCSISGKSNIGTTLVVWMDETPDHHLIDHNYFGPRPELGENGGETIRIGTSEWVTYKSNTIVEYNLFEECNGEIEIISNKTVGNEYRYNTFRNCIGTLTLRHGSYCKVYGNFFLGDVSKNCGGVRIIGEGHEVYNNYFENLSGTGYRAAISLVNGEVDAANSGYVQVTKAKIGFNTTVNCKEPFAIGAGKDSKKILPPEETLIANNLVKGRSGYPLVNDYDVSTGITWVANFVDVNDLGIDPVEGITISNFTLTKKDNLMRPDAGNICIGAASNDVLTDILIDIDGQTRPGTGRDAGCDQVLEGKIVIYPLTKEDLGY